MNTIKGSLVAIVTPMHDSGEIDIEAFEGLLDWHVESGTNGIVVVGTTGESATLSSDEHCDLVAHCVKYVNKRIPVIAGTGSNNTSEALYFTQSALEHGADAALLVTPYYNKPSQEGLYQHFKMIADRVDLPQRLYNVPGRTACDLALSTVERLADHPNIVAIKDATGDIPRGKQLIGSCKGRLDVYSGEDPLTRELILAGAAGTISVTANVAPALMSAMCAQALAGNAAEAAEIDAKLALLHADLFLEANPVPVKWALQRMGLIGPKIRLPLMELAAQYQLQVEAALKAAEIDLA